jgi:hypothetical protein
VAHYRRRIQSSLSLKKVRRLVVGPALRNVAESDTSGFRRIRYRDFGVHGKNCMLSQLTNAQKLTSRGDIEVSEFQDSGSE